MSWNSRKESFQNVTHTLNKINTGKYLLNLEKLIGEGSFHVVEQKLGVHGL